MITKALATTAFFKLIIVASAAATPVTVDTFIRAETDNYIRKYADQGGFSKFHHIREVTPIDKQDVIRMNRDTLYSMGVFDLTHPVTITKPETGERFQSMQVINQDHYTKMVKYDAGQYTLTAEGIGTRYVIVIFRTMIDPGKPGDAERVHAIQDAITVKQSIPGKLELTDWDEKSLDRLRDAINVLANTLPNSDGMFGDFDEVDPIKHLLGTAYGWGGNPSSAATYIITETSQNDGKTPYTLTVKDVPVDGFWSVSVYDNRGFFKKNKFNRYSVNNLSAARNKDGSVTIHFGGDPQRANYLPITKDWNYAVRLYRPRKEILDGSWAFPKPMLGKE